MTDPTPTQPLKLGPVLLRALLGLFLIALLTGGGLFLGLCFIGPCPQIEPRALIPVVGFGPALIGFVAGVVLALRLLRPRAGDRAS
ncbi:MAG: hypothetical protein HZA53_02735 [Planctomycetes bacterium]|nr:hypothetical protein [Planctomycetota bacterium]